MATLQVRSPDVCSQAVLRVIGQVECFFIGIKRGDSNDWAEDFFLEDTCRWVYVNEDSRLHEVALREFFRALATSNQLGFLLADLDVGRNLFVVLWVDRKSTRLNSSHVSISYAVFCLKKK